MLGLFVGFVPPFLLVVAAWFAARRPSRGGAVCGIALAGVLAAFPLMSLPLFWTSAAMLFAGLCLGLAQASVWAVRSTVAAVFVVIFGISLGQGLSRLHQLHAMRQTYPVQSLAERLAYESKHSESAVGTSKIAISSEVERGLIRAEEHHARPTYRQMQLSRLHNLTTDEFIMSPGFGVGRMVRVSHVIVGLPENPPIRQPDTADVPPSPADGSTSLDRVVAPQFDTLLQRPLPTVVGDLHQHSVADFFSPDRFGFVKSREHVVGFEPHQLSAKPEFSQTAGAVGDNWRIARLELVGLLKYDEPRVYESPYLPRMDELKDAPTRPLDEFETRALAVLRTDSDTAVDESPNVVRMLGSLRADKSCLECHTVRRGELLGAFSYELRRKQPVPEPPAKPPVEPAT